MLSPQDRDVAGSRESGDLLAQLRDLDLSRASDLARARALIEGIVHPDDSHAAALRWAAAQGEDDGLRTAAMERLVAMHGLVGRHQQAIAWSRRLLEIVGGSDTFQEVRAILNLAVSYRRQARDLEALCCMSRVRTMCERLDIREGLQRVALHRARLLAGLDVPDEALEALSGLLGRAAGELSPDVELEARILSVHLRPPRQGGGVEADLRRIDELSPPGERDAWQRCRIAFLRCSVSLLERRFDEAEALVDSIEHLVTPWEEWRLDVLEVRAQVAVGLKAADAPRWLEDLAVALRGLNGPEHGWGRLLRRARLAADLAREIGAAEIEAACLDLAASACLQRVRELVEPPLEPVCQEHDPHDLALLARAQANFARHQIELCDAIVEIAQSSDTPLARWYRDTVRGADGLVSICAWCRRIRTRDGRWLPLGELTVQSRHAPATHCICDDCLERQRPSASRRAEAG